MTKAELVAGLLSAYKGLKLNKQVYGVLKA